MRLAVISASDKVSAILARENIDAPACRLCRCAVGSLPCQRTCLGRQARRPHRRELELPKRGAPQQPPQPRRPHHRDVQNSVFPPGDPPPPPPTPPHPP